MNQLGLPLALNTKMLWRNFSGDKNQQIIEFLTNLFSQSSASVVYVYGDKSSGKTHLLQGCAFSHLILSGRCGCQYGAKGINNIIELVN